jgi:hypothetical protein
LEEAELLIEFLRLVLPCLGVSSNEGLRSRMRRRIGYDNPAHDDVTVSIHVFGERVQDEVGAQEDGGLEEGGGEGVVDEEEGVVWYGEEC